MAETSTELVKNVVVDYKDVTSWILLGFVILTGIFQYVQNVRLAKTVEKFKDDLAKNQVRFTRHSELQIECLKNYYELIVALHFSYRLIDTSNQSHHGLKKAIKNVQDDFIKVLFFSHRNQILLTDELVSQFDIIQKKFKVWGRLSNIEISSMSVLEDIEYTSDSESTYANPEEEIEAIQHRISKLNENPDIKTIEDDITIMRNLIETYFKQLVG